MKVNILREAINKKNFKILDIVQISETCFIAGQSDHKAVANVEELEPKKPGTVTIWYVVIPLSQVTNLLPRRLQCAYCLCGPKPSYQCVSSLWQ